MQVRAGKLEQGQELTREVVDYLASTELQGHGYHRDYSQQEAWSPWGPSQQATKSGPHAYWVVQGVTNGHTAIIGHGSQQETLTTPRYCPAAIWAKPCPSKMIGIVAKQLTSIWGTLDVV